MIVDRLEIILKKIYNNEIIKNFKRGKINDYYNL